MSLKEELLKKMKLLGIEPKRSLGQNFLINDYIVEQIFNHIDRRAPPYVVELGPGLGTLTERLIERNTPRKFIELDSRMAHYWRDRGEEVIEVDALKLDWSKIELPPGTLLLSNLPYQIGSRLVIELSMAASNIQLMVLMFQKEVAERLMAKISTKDYGFLSVVAQTFWSIDKIVDAASGDFYPAPKVSSRVVSMKRRVVPEQLDADYVQFVKTAFQHRRKYMIKSFSQVAQPIKKGLVEMGYKETVRAEEVTAIDFQNLYLNYVQSAL